MSDFTPSKGDCPVCDGEKRRCSFNNRTNLYHCRTDNPSPDFTFIKQDAIGFGMYKETALMIEQSAEKLAEYKRQREIDKRIIHTRYGPLDCSTAQGGLCRGASAMPVTQHSRPPTTGSNRQLSG